MKRKFSTILLFCLSFTIIAGSLSSCKEKYKDEDVKAAIETSLKSNPDYQPVTVAVKDGVASLGGEVKDEPTKSGAETSIKDIKGLKSVSNNITIMAAPMPSPTTTAPVIAATDSLSSKLPDAVKDNPGVKAEVNDGVVTLTGEIKKKDLPKLMQKINALHPKKVDSKLTVK